MPIVYPSGAARERRVRAVEPPAPATFSGTMRWPRIWLICSATMRAITSDVPPGAKGTIMVICLLG